MHNPAIFLGPVSRDFESLRVQVRDLGSDLIPLRSGGFCCEIRALISDGLEFTHGHFVSDHRYRGASHPDKIVLGMHFGPRGRAHYGPRIALQGDLSVLRPGQEQDGRVGGDFEYGALCIAPAELEGVVADLLANTDATLRDGCHFSAAPAIRAAACDELARLCRIAFSHENSMTDGRFNFMKSSLLYPYLLVAAHAMEPETRRSMLRSSEVVRRAESWVDAVDPETVHVVELCRALRMPLRSVQRAFRETLGIGPAQYLGYYRLHNVRRVLLQCDPTQTRITDVALDHGFWDVSRFAGRYRSVYGELPSATLKGRL